MLARVFGSPHSRIEQHEPALREGETQSAVPLVVTERRHCSFEIGRGGIRPIEPLVGLGYKPAGYRRAIHGHVAALGVPLESDRTELTNDLVPSLGTRGGPPRDQRWAESPLGEFSSWTRSGHREQAHRA